MALAPGADKVKVTQVAADVAGCAAVGTIEVPKLPNGQVNDLDTGTQFRNQVIGLGGNAGFVTDAYYYRVLRQRGLRIVVRSRSRLGKT